MKKLMKIFLKSFAYVLRIEYFFLSRLSFLKLKIKGTNFKKRMGSIKNLSYLKKKINKNIDKRLAIFVAYHTFKDIPENNLNYIKLLKDSSFDIMYVHNGELDKKTKEELVDLGCYLVIRENIGQDFGAWKDSLLLLDEYQITDKLNWILLCNDSNFCLGGNNAKDFIKKFKTNLEIKNNYDFISLNCNFEGDMHYQSFFLCLSNKIFKDQNFKKFWKNYIPFDNRFHAINKGEKYFSKQILSKFKPKVIYTSYELCKNMKTNSNNNYQTILNQLPKNFFFLETCFLNKGSQNNKDIALGISRIINTLESYNPSHVFGILNIVYLNSPFLKKDVVRIGVFSISQIYDVLQMNDLNLSDKVKDEILTSLTIQGTSYSFLNTQRIAVRKGIPQMKNLYEHHHNSQTLKRMNFFRAKNDSSKNIDLTNVK